MQSGPGSNVNGGVFHSSQISRTGPSSSDTVSCHTRHPPYFFFFFFFARDSICPFYALPTQLNKRNVISEGTILITVFFSLKMKF